jgi:tetratricopeptide (TPR) repeat protein
LAQNDDPYFDSNLTEEDYRRYFTFSWRWYGTVFLSILVVLSGLLYWFSGTMRANSNVRVREAVKVLETYEADRMTAADTADRELNPLTLEIEEMRINTEETRQFIAETLMMDSYPRKMNQRLKQRYLQQSFYAELPADWKQNLPEQLRQYKNQQDEQQILQLRYRLNRVSKMVEENRERVRRIEEIRKQMDLSDTFDRMVDSYRRTRDLFQTRLSDLESAMSDVHTDTYTRRRLPGDVFRGLTRLLDPLTLMGLQYRRFSALSSPQASVVYAEQILRDAERIDPKNPEVYYQLGRVYERLGMGNVSNEHYLKALRVARGQDYRREDDIVDMFETVLDENPDSSRAHYDVAFAYYETGQEPRALDHLLSVLENECAIEGLPGVRQAFEKGNNDRAMAMVRAVAAEKCGERSMVQTLAIKRIEYILEGETPYYRLTYF